MGNERAGVVPEWDLGDRLRKALRVSGLSVQGMADELGVTRQAISRYLSGKVKPRRMALVAWAQLCGVSLDWLETGTD